MDHANLTTVDARLDIKLRPRMLKEFIGHEEIKDRLHIIIKAAKQRNEPMNHTIIHGPPGLGKTTLANILASEMQGNIIISSGPSIEKPGDLAGILTNLNPGDFLFIDEIHRLQRSIEEYLYSAMEDFKLDLTIDSGSSARSVQVSLNPFTLIGATTKMGNLSSPLRSRFPINLRLNLYKESALCAIVLRSADILGVDINEKAALAIAKRSRGTPRLANNLLRWVRDIAQVQNNNIIDETVVEHASNMCAIDEKGLDEMDKTILELIIKQHRGGPVGIKSIAASIGEEQVTLEEVYEPYLIMQGFIKRTPRGREATDLAYSYLGLQKEGMD